MKTSPGPEQEAPYWDWQTEAGRPLEQTRVERLVSGSRMVLSALVREEVVPVGRPEMMVTRVVRANVRRS